ncbi:MAG: HAD family hydrolase [Methanotrichaceae archaeon]
MQKLAVVFDSAGTILRTYRVAKDIRRGILLKDILTSDLIMEKCGRALIVPQFDANLILSCSPDTPIRSLLDENSIEISCASAPISREKAIEILNNSETKMADVQETYSAVKAKCPDTYSSAGMIIDVELGEVAYAISTGGTPFPGLTSVLNQLKNLEAEIYVASGDSMRSLIHLEDFGIKPDHIYPTANPKRKREIVYKLKERYRKVVMVGDGLNDIYALEAADLGVLTTQQNSSPPINLIRVADRVIDDILELPDFLKCIAA